VHNGPHWECGGSKLRRTRHIAVCIAALALGGGVFAASASDPAQIYKWVDNQGVVHYGDSIPPQYAQDSSTQLNQQGVVVGHIDRPKDAAQEAEERVAAEARQRAQHDQFLLSTYTSVQDISQLRDERLDQLDGQVKATTAYIQSLDARLATLQERATHYKPLSKDPKAANIPDFLAQDIERTTQENRSQQRALANTRKEEAATRAQFAADIARYSELTAPKNISR
jgi:hypothetical protein